MRVVFVEGFRAGQRRASLGSFSRGVVVGLLLALLGIGAAVAQQIPPQANEYRRDLTRLSRSVWGMDAPVSALAAQIHQESGWRRDAVSRVGAQGLAQFMPSTARWIAKVYGDAAAPLDPRWSMLYQSRYMKDLYEDVRFATDRCERYAFALAAYNGGMGWVRKRQMLSQHPETCLHQTCEINPGILPSNQRENSEYPERILLRLTPIYQKAQWGPGRCAT